MADSESPIPTVNVVRSTKRRAKSMALRPPRAKRIKSFYNDKYRELYNSVVEGHFCSPGIGHSQYLDASQIGSSFWTEAEKNAFFHILARKGRHNIKAIAIELASKSEPEIGQYIELLRKGLIDAELLPKRPLFLDNPDFEAAYDISPECMASLDQVGDALSICQQVQDEKVERAKQGETWLLTPTIGNWVDRCVQRGKEKENEASQLVPEAILLDLKCFLWLSKRFFMNSSDLEYNWTSYAEDAKDPTIMHTAFTDFHTLVVDFTKRLVQSTLHFAIARSRAEDSSNSRHKRTVSLQDVATALEVLGLRGSMSSHWSGVARRCNLRVFEDERTTRVISKSYSHDEVEVLLTEHQTVENEDPSIASGDCESMDNEHSTISENQSLSSADPEADDANSSGSRSGSPGFQQDGEILSAEEHREQLRDVTLECLDQRNSQVEEMRLWELLGESGASQLDPVDRDGKSDSWIATRKGKEELVSWTSWIDFATEWETLKSPVPVGLPPKSSSI